MPAAFVQDFNREDLPDVPDKMGVMTLMRNIYNPRLSRLCIVTLTWVTIKYLTYRTS